MNLVRPSLRRFGRRGAPAKTDRDRTRALRFVGRSTRRASQALALVLTGVLLPRVATSQEVVSFPSDDGGRLQAHVYGAGARGVVLAHGARFNKESWAKQAVALADAGFRVLALDFRGYGQSVGPGQSDPIGAPLHLDVLAAVRYLRAMGARTVSVVGASMGGGAAAGAAVEATPGEIDRLILMAHVPIAHPERITMPTLFIVSRDDGRASGTPRLVGIREQYEKATGPKELVVLDGSAHAQFIFDTDQGERLMREILRFLSDR